jgi:undecaprenyl-diphosphatase
MRRDSNPLALRHAVSLGLAQGPTELLPVSSSGHTALIPWLAGWPYCELDPDTRKSFEVLLHAGSAAALLIGARRELSADLCHIDARRAQTIILSLLPPVLVGYALEGRIQRRLSDPPAIAAGLLAGAVAMALADARPARGTRRLKDARPRDGLALGLAQAVALVPGVSRYGATLAAARALGFGRREAQALSWQAALPVIIGAGALKGLRLARAGTPRGHTRVLVAGGMTAFLSTLASARLLAGTARETHSLLPYSLYRSLLAALVIHRLRARSTAHGGGIDGEKGGHPQAGEQADLGAPPRLCAQ